MSRSAVFLDRDGVLNEVTAGADGIPRPPANVEAMRLCPDAVGACRALREAGYLLIMVTNQPDVSRGTQQRDVVDAINSAVGERLGLDEARVVNSIDRYGNTSSATLPIALADARDRGMLEPGMNVLLSAFGSGFTWGAGVIEWAA